MLTPNDLQELVRVGGMHPDWNPDRRRRELDEALRRLGDPTDTEIVSTALAGLDSDDRNVRAAMLRVLGLYGGDAATAGILRGLADPKRRVRDVAMRSALPHHVSSTRVIEAMRSIAEDELETSQLRRLAFFILSSGTARDALPDETREVLSALMESRQFRLPILVRLCKSTNHSDDTRAILQDFVRTGTKDEAVMATRALCGYSLVRVDAWLDPEQRQRVRATYDRAPEIRGSKIGDGPVNYWIPHEAVTQLLRDSGYSRNP